MGQIYVIEFDNGLIKVGRSTNANQRIKSHVGSVNAISGGKLINKWVSEDHTNEAENELKVIRFCASKYGRSDKARLSREWIVCANFDEIVKFASNLTIKKEYKEKSDRSDAVVDRLYGTAEQIQERNKLALSYSCAQELEFFIQNSLGISCDLFETKEKIGMSAFVIVVGVYFASENPIEMLINCTADIAESPSDYFFEVMKIYNDASRFVQEKASEMQYKSLATVLTNND